MIRKRVKTDLPDSYDKRQAKFVSLHSAGEVLASTPYLIEFFEECVDGYGNKNVFIVVWYKSYEIRRTIYKYVLYYTSLWAWNKYMKRLLFDTRQDLNWKQLGF